MKFKLNDKVKMRTDKRYWDKRYWDKGDIGRIVKIDSYFNSDFGSYGVLYEVCFDVNCTDASSCEHHNTHWANERSMDHVHHLMKVE